MNERRAIIDIGSNTVRLVVYNGPLRAPVVLLNEKVTPRLGRDVAKTGMLAEKSMETALSALARHATLLEMMGVDDVETVATAAVRDAENGAEFLKAIGKLGLRPRLLSGEEEARASAMGVIAAFPGARGVVGDLGGGSLELIGIAKGQCEGGVTLPYGTLRLPDLRADGEERFAETVRKGLKSAGWSGGQGQPFYIVGGSWRALALYAMQKLDWPLDDPHDFELEPSVASKICAELAGGEVDDDTPRISSSRMASLPDGAALLGALVEAIEPSRIVFSSWGLREGLLYAGLDEETQAENPMLAGVAAFAQRYNVEEATARRVSDWIGGILPKSAKTDKALRHAATMLAMAAMRSEPNLRTEQAMNWALRKRWVGLDARGRALVAMAVLANTGQTETPDEFKGLADKDELKWAVACGLAIRVCRKLTTMTADGIAASELARDDDHLVLRLNERGRALISNSVAKNLGKLADWLELEWRVECAGK